MVPCSIEFFSRKNSKQPNVHGCTFGCDGIRGGSELTSLSMLGREFACRKLTALTGGQWFTAKSSLQCKLEVKECTGRTFFNDDIRVRSESAHPCIGFVSSFFHKLDNLKEDRLLEKGKHAELLEKTGYYTKLWNAQIEA